MKKLSSLIIFLIFIVISSNLSAQIGDAGKFIAGGVEDAEKLLKAYLTPWANGLGTALSGGWYNTAKVHKLGGFDLTITLNSAFIPKADKTFNLDDLNLQADYTENIAPTAAGKSKVGPEISYFNGLISYNTPKGTGLGIVPSPMIQAGIGLIKGTEINIRYMPSPELGSYGSFGLWGLGLKHDILQWLPIVDKVPFLNVAIQGGFTKLNYSKDIKVTPADIQATDNTSGINWDDQKLSLGISSLTINLLVSVNFPVVSIYAGGGIANSKTELAMKGTYPVPEVNGTVTNNSVKKDPINVKIESFSGSPTKPRLNGGIRFKLGVITFHADYTYAYYSNLTLGLGVSFR